MKKIILLAFVLPLFATAQLGLLSGKNIIKTNLSGDAIGNYNLTYERSIAKKFSLSVGVRYMPKVGLPSFVQSIVEKYIDDKDVHLADFKMGNFAITPEFRMYLSAGKMKGFYIAPYIRYASFDLDVPVTYTYQSATASAMFNGVFTSLSAGLLLGTQFQIAKKLVLDIWLVGGHYGTSNGTIVANQFNPAIANQQQADALQTKLDEIKQVGPFKFEGKVSSDFKSAEITTTGSWAGVRAGGISLGVRF